MGFDGRQVAHEVALKVHPQLSHRLKPNFYNFDEFKLVVLNPSKYIFIVHLVRIVVVNMVLVINLLKLEKLT